MKADNKYYEKSMAALNITLCPNGNQYIRKKLVLNRKRIPNLEVLLDNATQLLGARNCVRLLRTPKNGTRVQNLDNMVDGGLYVAIVGPSEKLKRLEYNGPSKLPHKPQNDRPRHIRPKPVAQSRAFQEGLAEASRFRIIHVYRNDEDKSMKILLDKRLLYSMEKVLQHISDKLRMRTGAVRSIYNQNGQEIKETTGIQNNGTYVAVGFGQRFIRSQYKTNKNNNNNNNNSKKKHELLAPRRPAQNKFSGPESPKKKKKSPGITAATNITTTTSTTSTNQIDTSLDKKETRMNNKVDDSFDKTYDKNDHDRLSSSPAIDNDTIDTIDNVPDLNHNHREEETTEREQTNDAVLSNIKREGTFDKTSTADEQEEENRVENDFLDTTNQKHDKSIIDKNNKTDDSLDTTHEKPDVENKKKSKKSKAFGPSFEKALSKTERSNTITSENDSTSAAQSGAREEEGTETQQKVNNIEKTQKTSRNNKQRRKSTKRKEKGDDKVEKEQTRNDKTPKIKQKLKESPPRSSPPRGDKEDKSSRNHRVSTRRKSVPPPASSGSNEPDENAKESLVGVSSEIESAGATATETTSKNTVENTTTQKQQQQDLDKITRVSTVSPQEKVVDDDDNVSEVSDVTDTYIEDMDDGEKIEARRTTDSAQSGDRKASPLLFQASGDQSEKAEAVIESKNTKVDKPIDMLPAEEVDEEIAEEDRDDDQENASRSNSSSRKK